MSLTEADKIYLGSEVVNSVYVGADKAWPVTQTWTPGQIAGLKIWLDASQLGLADGAPVSPWPNLANPAVPGSMLGAPPPQVRAGALNGLPVVRFTSTGGQLRMNGTGITLPWTVAYVGRLWDVSATARMIAAYNAADVNMLIGYYNTYMDIGYDNGFFGNGINANTEWRLYSGDCPSFGETRMFKDGVALAPLPSGGGGWGGMLFISGYVPAGAGGESGNVEVAEVCMYDRKLSDVERQEAEDYLRQKWIPSWGPEEGIYLPSATPATGGNYDGTFAVGNRIQVLTGGRITGIRYWRPSGTPDTRSVDLWTDAGALLAHGMSTGVVGWNTFPITPVAVAAGDIIRVTHGFSGTGDSWPYTNSAYVSASPNLQWLLGVFSPPLPSGGQDDFPSSTTTDYNYFVDVVYQEQL